MGASVQKGYVYKKCLASDSLSRREVIIILALQARVLALLKSACMVRHILWVHSKHARKHKHIERQQETYGERWVLTAGPHPSTFACSADSRVHTPLGAILVSGELAVGGPRIRNMRDDISNDMAKELWEE
jgi:hypothetical protein